MSIRLESLVFIDDHGIFHCFMYVFCPPFVPNEDKCSTFHFVQRTDESFCTCFSNVVNRCSKDGLGAVVMGLLMIKCPEGIARGLVMSIYGAVIG